MQPLKKWIKTGKTSYALWDREQEIGTMEIALGTLTRKATATFEGRTIEITKTGFWRNNLEITDPKGEIIAKVYPKKWYAETLSFDYNDSQYKIVYRNNPLAECALFVQNQELLAYGINTGNEDGKVNIKITNSAKKQDFIFDFILWYLFLPIATENMDDNFTFLLLIA
ncbi:hypothetical protein BH11BAC2_BH11BAC2_07090 [soil metagenome]